MHDQRHSAWSHICEGELWAQGLIPASPLSQKHLLLRDVAVMRSVSVEKECPVWVLQFPPSVLGSDCHVNRGMGGRTDISKGLR